MSRYAHPLSTPGQATIEGDSEFSSVNMKEDRETLPPGVLALSINKRLRTKRATPRGGTFPPIHFNVLGLADIRCVGVYSNPNKEEVLLVATADKVYAMRDGSYPAEISLEPGQTIDEGAEFVQAHDKVFIFRGTEKKQLIWNGVDPEGFELIVKSDPLDMSTQLIPQAVTAEPAQDRLLIISGTSDVIATDIDDFTSYDHAFSVFHVGREAGDPIVRVFHYAKALAIVFCRRSSYLLGNYTKDPNEHTIELLNSRLGLAGRKAVVMEGADVLFLSEPGGIYRMSQSFENRQEVPSLPVSDPIQPLIDRINWKAATGAVAEQLGEYVYFAVPIDESEFNNALIVYNAATKLIEGYDTWTAGFRIDELKVTLFRGVRRLFAIDKPGGHIYVLEEGKSDFIYPGEEEGEEAEEHQINDLIETRGYATLGWNASSSRAFKRTEIHVRTWAPSIEITDLTQGAGDERLKTFDPITKDRRVYDQFGKNKWDPTNVNDDWATPGRQDYSIVADETGFDPGSGIDPERKQYHCLPFALRTRALFVSYRIANSQGSCEVMAVGPVESVGTSRQVRRAA